MCMYRYIHIAFARLIDCFVLLLLSLSPPAPAFTAAAGGGLRYALKQASGACSPEKGIYALCGECRLVYHGSCSYGVERVGCHCKAAHHLGRWRPRTDQAAAPFSATT